MAYWRSRAFLALLPALAVFVLVIATPNLGPAWRAHTGDGTPGTFVATHEECSYGRYGRRACGWKGDFTALDGSVRRAGVRLQDEPDGLRAGDEVAAQDTGAREKVYHGDGGIDWLVTTGAVSAAAVVVVAYLIWSGFWFRRYRRDRAENRRMAREDYERKFSRSLREP